MKAFKIGIIGAECSGKTTCAEYLFNVYASYINKYKYQHTHRYRCIIVYEYLRYFCRKYELPKNILQQRYIAQKQIEIESALNNINTNNEVNYLFCDTTPLNTYIYTMHYFNVDDLYLKNLALKHQYTYNCTILLRNLPWVQDKDKQRDSPQVQNKIYGLLKDVLRHNNIYCIECNIEDICNMKIADLNTLFSYNC